MSEESVPGVLQRIVDAINAGDADAFISAFAADGSIEDWGRVLSGAEEIRRWAVAEAIDAGATMRMLRADPAAEPAAHVAAGSLSDSAEARLAWRGRGFTIESTASVTVRGDRAVSLRLVPYTS